MERSIIYRVELSQIFPEDSGKTLEHFLRGITKEFILKAGSFLISFQKDKRFSEDNKKVIEDWFRHENQEVAQTIFTRIQEIERKNNWKAVIINAHTTLKLLEAAFSREEKEILQSEPEMEINLFKAYVLLNELDNQKDNGLLDSLKVHDDKLKFALLVFTQTLRYADIANFYMKEVFTGQFVRGCLVMKFLQRKYPELLAAFLGHFELKGWTEFFKRYLPLVHLSLNNNERKFTEISINENRKRTLAFINKVAIKKDDEELVPYDFVTLRANPLFQSNENSFRVIYDLFLIEKMYNGLYFLLKNVNESLSLNFNVRDIFTYEFSEKEVLYTVLSGIYGKGYRIFSGAELDDRGIKGAPDYYVARGNRIMLFESKDVFIDAKTKESANYETYEAAVKKRFYFEQKEKKIKHRAVLQQIGVIKKLLSGSLEFDKPVPSKIYPIIIIHNKQLNVAGLNHLINHWFNLELNKLKDEGFDIKNVRPITVVDIASLILYMDYLKFDKINLPKLIDEYQKKTSVEAKMKVRNTAELEKVLLERTLSFSHFLRKKMDKPEPPRLFWDLAREVTS